MGKDSSDCFDCKLGQYCNGWNLSEPTGPCMAGYYCLRGNVEPNPTGNYMNTETLNWTMMKVLERSGNGEMGGKRCRVGNEAERVTKRKVEE